MPLDPTCGIDVDGTHVPAAVAAFETGQARYFCSDLCYTLYRADRVRRTAAAHLARDIPLGFARRDRGSLLAC